MRRCSCGAGPRSLKALTLIGSRVIANNLKISLSLRFTMIYIFMLFAKIEVITECLRYYNMLLLFILYTLAKVADLGDGDLFGGFQQMRGCVA